VSSGGKQMRRDETDLERVDRNLSELLQELRVALPGVQVLFAFLLVLPFSQGFADVTGFQKGVYFVTLMLTAAAAVCLIAPSMHHRLLFRRDAKLQILNTANRLTIIGLSLLALAMIGVVLMITDFLFDAGIAIAATVVTALAFGGVWLVLPLQERRASRL
jgi:Family of unknown function (DUF6328)